MQVMFHVAFIEDFAGIEFSLFVKKENAISFLNKRMEDYKEVGDDFEIDDIGDQEVIFFFAKSKESEDHYLFGKSLKIEDIDSFKELSLSELMSP